MPDIIKQDIENIYPVLNNEIKHDWEIEEECKLENRYPIFLDHIQSFYKTHLNTNAFRPLPQYKGRIKCIYIDPPYNTGKENWG